MKILNGNDKLVCKLENKLHEQCDKKSKQLTFAYEKLSFGFISGLDELRRFMLALHPEFELRIDCKDRFYIVETKTGEAIQYDGISEAK
jgi:hypothetical protein